MATYESIKYNFIPASTDTGALCLIKSLTASSDSTLSFADGSSDVVMDDTYRTYVFKFIAMHPATDAVNFGVQFNAAGGSGYNETITSNSLNSYHKEDGSGGAMRINEDGDQGEGTALQWLSGGSTITETGNDSDQCVSGTLFIFDPSSTTYMKQFIAVSNDSEAADYSNSSHVSGIINTTSAIDEVQFKFSSGNVDSGVINMYGIL
jgi:hypothetical protein